MKIGNYVLVLSFFGLILLFRTPGVDQDFVIDILFSIFGVFFISTVSLYLCSKRVETYLRREYLSCFMLIPPDWISGERRKIYRKICSITILTLLFILIGLVVFYPKR